MCALLASCVVLGVVQLALYSNAQDLAVREEEDDTQIKRGEKVSGEQIRVLHRRFDANSDGKVSLDEIMAFSEKARKDMNEKRSWLFFDEEFDLMDFDKDGQITKNEFVQMSIGQPVSDDNLLPPPEAEEEKKLEELKTVEGEKFKAADKDGDGYLTRDEARVALNPALDDGLMHLQTIQYLKERDTDGDGMLTYDEFWDSHDPDNLEQQKEDFKILDSDANGKIDVEEYKKWHTGDSHVPDAMRNLMGIADADSDGHLTAAELNKVRPSLANHKATLKFVQWMEHYEL
jgi:Ca2+-binding EF-hand superfamily protein